MRAWLAVAVTLAAASAACAEDWPPLPATGFVAGRPATDADVEAGNAVFVLKAYGSYFGKPIDIPIPQYAYLTKKDSKPLPVIVIQAEIGKGVKVYGVRALDGTTSVARNFELQLLGTKPPN